MHRACFGVWPSAEAKNLKPCASGRARYPEAETLSLPFLESLWKGNLMQNTILWLTAEGSLAHLIIIMSFGSDFLWQEGYEPARKMCHSRMYHLDKWQINPLAWMRNDTGTSYECVWVHNLLHGHKSTSLFLAGSWVMTSGSQWAQESYSLLSFSCYNASWWTKSQWNLEWRLLGITRFWLYSRSWSVSDRRTNTSELAE